MKEQESPEFAMPLAGLAAVMMDYIVVQLHNGWLPNSPNCI